MYLCVFISFQRCFVSLSLLSYLSSFFFPSFLPLSSSIDKVAEVINNGNVLIVRDQDRAQGRRCKGEFSKEIVSEWKSCSSFVISVMRLNDCVHREDRESAHGWCRNCESCCLFLMFCCSVVIYSNFCQKFPLYYYCFSLMCSVILLFCCFSSFLYSHLVVLFHTSVFVFLLLLFSPFLFPVFILLFIKYFVMLLLFLIPFPLFIVIYL